jgi:hypothetical protein
MVASVTQSSLMLRSRWRDNDTDGYELEAQSKQVAVRRAFAKRDGVRRAPARAGSEPCEVTTIDTIMPTAASSARTSRSDGVVSDAVPESQRRLRRKS